MDDNRDIAFLAASCEREMKQTLAGSGLKYNRTDFRRFLGNSGNGYPQHPAAPYPQQYIQQQLYPQQPPPNYYQNYNNPVDPVIPEGVLPPSNQQFIPMPQGVMPQQPQIAGSQIMTSGGFEMPDYSKSPKTYLEDEQEFRDALIEKIKALTNSIKAQKTQINKLTKMVESLILLMSKDTQEQSTDSDTNENSDQS